MEYIIGAGGGGGAGAVTFFSTDINFNCADLIKCSFHRSCSLECVIVIGNLQKLTGVLFSLFLQISTGLFATDNHLAYGKFPGLFTLIIHRV